VALHFKKREGHVKTAGAGRTIIPDGETTSSIEAATAPKLTAAGELSMQRGCYGCECPLDWGSTSPRALLK